MQIDGSAAAGFRDSCEVECVLPLRHLPNRRSVWLASAGNRKILVKIYEVHPKQKRDADLEWFSAVALHGLGLQIPEPLFRGQTESGQFVVAFDFIPDGETLNRALANMGEQEQAGMFAQLVALHAQQHAAGWYQDDNHLGNYLWSRGTLWMLDAGTCRQGKAPLAAAQRVSNIAELTANIPLQARGVYDRVLGETYPVPLRGLEKATSLAIRRRVRKYARKTRRSCSEFEYGHGSGKAWYSSRELEPELKAKMLEDPDQFFEGKPWVKDGNTCTVVELEHGGRPYILKRYNQKALGYRVLHAAATPRALSSWTGGHVLRLFGIPTPRPWAVLLVKCGLLLRKAYLLMDKVGGVALDQLDPLEMEKMLPKIAGEFQCRWSELDALRAAHGDMKSGNFVMHPAGLLELIDLDSLVFFRRSTAHQRAKKKDYARFLRNWEQRPGWVAEFRKRVEEG